MSGPVVVSARQVASLLTRPALVEALHAAFSATGAHAIIAPPRHHHPLPAEAGATLLLMPAWTGAAPPAGGGYLGVKMVTVHPGNARRGLPTVLGVYLLCAADTASDIAGDLRELAALGPPDAADRIAAHDYSRPTVFKSVGHGLEDLAAAALVYEGL